jgi:hypothetical protein
MQMDGASGYILNGIRVIPNTEEKKKDTREKNTNRKGKGKEGDSEEGKGTKRKSSVDGEDPPEQKSTKTDTGN